MQARSVRSPGLFPGGLPDSASLHPGYEVDVSTNVSKMPNQELSYQSNRSGARVTGSNSAQIDDNLIPLGGHQPLTARHGQRRGAPARAAQVHGYLHA